VPTAQRSWEEPGPASAWSRRASLLLALLLALALWPPLGAPLDGSFDSSWRWAVNEAAARHLPPGMLPAGPLGAWIEPRAVAAGSLLPAAAFTVVERILWALALIGLARRGGSAWRWLGVAVLWIAALVVCARWPDHDLVLLVAVLLLPWAEGEPLPAWRAGAAGALVGLAPFLKLSAGLAALGVVAGASVARRWAERQRGSARGLALLTAGWIAASVTSSWLAFDSLASVGRWLVAIPEVLRGYGSAMGLDRGVVAERAAIVPLLAIGALVALSGARRGETRGLVAGLALPLAASLKHALVRPDLHALSSVYLGGVTLLLVALTVRARRTAWLAVALAVLTLVVALPQARAVGNLTRPDSLSALLTLREGTRNAAQTLTPGARFEHLRALETTALGGLRDPALAARLGESGGVDALPWRLTRLTALQLEARWVPSPSFQLYQASTPALEALGAAHFAEAGAPRWLLLERDAVDGRNLLWEAPRTWRAIAACYEVRERVGDVLLLERRRAAGVWSRREAGRGTLAWNEWIEPPAVAEGESLEGEIVLTPTWPGWLRQLALRAEPVWVDLRSGRQQRRFRLVPELARFGLELGAPPRSLDELRGWLERRSVVTVTALRLRSADAARYRPPEVRWVARRLESGRD